MKILASVLLMLVASSAFSADITGGKILNYLKPGLYIGVGCKVNVLVQDTYKGKTVTVAVNGRDEFARFNSVELGKKSTEVARAKSYLGKVEASEDKHYSLEISKKAYIVDVTVIEKRNFLGLWSVEREAFCSIDL